MLMLCGRYGGAAGGGGGSGGGAEESTSTRRGVGRAGGSGAREAVCAAGACLDARNDRFDRAGPRLEPGHEKVVKVLLGAARAALHQARDVRGGCTEQLLRDCADKFGEERARASGTSTGGGCWRRRWRRKTTARCSWPECSSARRW